MGRYLRDYQVEIFNRVFSHLKKLDSLLIQMPTGTGKTTVFSSIVKEQITHVSPNKRVLLIVHRKELVEQIYLRLRKFGINAGIIMAGQDYKPEMQVQIASLQTLIRKKELPKNISLLIIDEAHHVLSKSYLKLISIYNTSKLLGFTATPIRLNGEGFDKVFNKLITSETIEWFIKKRYLSQYKHLSLKDEGINKLSVNSKTKDYDDFTSSTYMQSEIKIADVYLAFEKYSKLRKTIIFCVDVKHMDLLAAKFIKEGIKCGSIDSKTSKEDRKSILDRFIQNEITVLFNVNIFTEGFDCPDIETVILARPTKSLALYIQQVGRVLRYKENNYGLIIDCANLIFEHGSINSDFRWTLDSKVIKENKEGFSSSKNNNKVQESHVEEYLFKELDVVDSFTIKPTLNWMLKALPQIFNAKNDDFRKVSDLNLFQSDEILDSLRVRYKSEDILSKNEKTKLKSKAKELHKSLSDNEKQKNKIHDLKKDINKRSKVEYKKLSFKDIEEIKKEMELVFNIQ